MNKVKRISGSLKALNKAEDRRKIASINRLWVQDTKKIHILNYWWYRYFTNELELYILDAIRFVTTDVPAPPDKVIR